MKTSTWIAALLCAALIPCSALAGDLEGEWRVRGQRDGQTYEGRASVGGAALRWSVEGAREEELSGGVARDEASLWLYKPLGASQRLIRFFTRKRTLRYRGSIQRVSASELRVVLSANGRPAGEETWTRASAPAPSPQPAPAPAPQPAPAPIPGPGQLPFVHPDTFVPLPGTDVWHVSFHPSLFAQDMARRGLASGDAATDRVMLLRLQSLILQHVNQKYRRAATGQAVAGQSWKISFTARAPSADPRVFPGVATPQVGRDYSRMEIGGTAGGTHGRVPRNDTDNRVREDNSGTRWGVFSGSITGTDSTLSPALSASDRRYVDGSYLLGDGDAAQDRRFLRVQEVSSNWAYALASTLSHEIGHSVGCPHTGKTAFGRVYRAGPALSLMRHVKSRALLSEPGTRFFEENQRRLDQGLGLER